MNTKKKQSSRQDKIRIENMYSISHIRYLNKKLAAAKEKTLLKHEYFSCTL